MKEETKQQAPAIGAIILAVITAVTTTAQYCKAAEETRQVEATHARSTEAIIVGLSKEIASLQEDVDDLYRNTERLQVTLDIYRSSDLFKPKSLVRLPLHGDSAWIDDGHDSDADGVPDFLDPQTIAPQIQQRAEPSSPGDISKRIYDMMEDSDLTN